MRNNKEMSLQEHLDTADDLAIAFHHLRKVYDRCQNYYTKNSRLLTLLWKVYPLQIAGPFIKIKSLLDDDYHRIINDIQFKELGHIYYNLEKRYLAIQGKNNDEGEPQSTNP